MNYRWTLKEKPNDDTIQNLSKTLKIPVPLAEVLAGRGIASPEEAKAFFKPSLEQLLDPFLMKDMDKAVDRILKAVSSNEGIWIHGDYDVDGTSSTSLLLKFLRELGAKVDYFIPDRFQDGYGLSHKSIDLAKKYGNTVLVTVDVGVTAIEQFQYAKSQGFDCIIVDHHQPDDTLPDVLAILDPIVPGDDYPFKHLSASGVAFKLVQALCHRKGMPEKAYEYLDFVALASVADMVPLTGENRSMVYFGLKMMNENPRPGFKGLLHCTRIKPGTINSTNIVFSLAPIINAAGRMGDAIRSVEMMTSDDEFSAFRIAQQLEDENRKRRVYDYQTFEEAIPLAAEQVALGRKSIVIHQPHWHAGVIGIVASRLADKFNLPTVLMTTIGGLAKGSSRSNNAFDVHAGLKAASHLMVEYGGHRHAAGLSLPEKDITELREIFDNLAKQHISNDMLTPEILVDTELKFTELSPSFIQSLNKFAPYGYANQKPVFYSKDVTSANGVKILGNNTLKFRAFQNNFVIDAIGYNLAHKYDICTSGKPFSIVYNIEINTFNDQNTPQLQIKDIRLENK